MISRMSWDKKLVIASLCSCLPFFSAMAADGITTANKTSTYYSFGEDLKHFVTPSLNVVPSNGSVDNVKALSKSAGITFAIVQSDVYQAYVHLAKEDPDPSIRQWAHELISSLRVVMPLYDEEVYFIVNKDSPLKSVLDIEDKRLAIGPVGSGTNLTAKNIYKKLFGKAPKVVEPFIEPGVAGDDEGTKIRRSALWRLAHPDLGPDNRKVDVFVLVDGQPVELLAKLGPDFRVLTVDAGNEKIKSLLSDYKIGALDKKNYGFLTKDEPVITVPSYLITAHFRSEVRNEFIRDFAASLCKNYDKLYTQGHSKWKSIPWSPANSTLPELASGWRYSDVTRPVLEACRGALLMDSSSALPCSVEDRAIGLCE
jgi:TRAP-type uncharacterized transport system substrate-binding protein